MRNLKVERDYVSRVKWESGSKVTENEPDVIEEFTDVSSL